MTILQNAYTVNLHILTFQEVKMQEDSHSALLHRWETFWRRLIRNGNNLTLKNDFSCFDCGINTRREFYMVDHSLWYYCGVRVGLLCIECLERRMQRFLCWFDFTPCVLNKKNYWSEKISDRLRNRYFALLEDQCARNHSITGRENNSFC